VTARSCGAAPMARREASCAALLSPAEPGGHRGGSPGSVRGSPEALSGDPLTDPADVWSRGSPDRQISADWRSTMVGESYHRPQHSTHCMLCAVLCALCSSLKAVQCAIVAPAGATAAVVLWCGTSGTHARTAVCCVRVCDPTRHANSLSAAPASDRQRSPRIPSPPCPFVFCTASGAPGAATGWAPLQYRPPLPRSTAQP
jgi:hypothetical protein